METFKEKEAMDVNSRYKKLDLTKIDGNANVFIVGDIHGRYSMLKNVLYHSGYEDERDYVFAVGDLIDRGDENLQVVQFFTSHPRRFSVRGNHEDMMLDQFSREMWVQNGGYETLMELHNNFYDEEWLKDQLRHLPYIIDVTTRKGEFRVVHAEIPCHITEKEFQKEVLMQSTHIWETLLWSRKNSVIFRDRQFLKDDDPRTNIVEKMESMMGEINNSLENNHEILCFCGHTPVRDPVILPNKINLDLGMRDMAIYNFTYNSVVRYSDNADET